MKTADLRIRDPFVLADPATKTVYLYAQSGNRAGSGFLGVEAYASQDLQNWTPPRPVLELPGNAGIQMVWAPEVHAYQRSFVLFVTLTFEETLPQAKPVETPDWPDMHRRGTHVYRARGPLGPFEPLKETSHTPEDWMALDGTLYVEGDTPYLVFCHEWVQVVDGTMDCVQLAEDLSGTVGRPQLLFKASSAPGLSSPAGSLRGSRRVTDGPFLYTSPQTGRLFMIWSTFIPDSGYCVVLARSESGQIGGPWTQDKILYARDGGHGMLFRSLDGDLLMALHQPNQAGRERMHLYPVTDTGETLAIEGEG